MSFDPTIRDSTWTCIQPGCWIDPQGHAHLFPDEVLAYLQALYPNAGFDPHSKADYDLVVKQFSEALLKQHPHLNIRRVHHTRFMD